MMMIALMVMTMMMMMTIISSKPTDYVPFFAARKPSVPFFAARVELRVVRGSGGDVSGAAAGVHVHRC